MQPYPYSPYRFMLLYAKRNIGIFLLMIFALLCGIVAGKLSPYYFSKLVSLFENNVDFSTIKKPFFIFFLLMIGCRILADVLDFLMNYLTDVVFQPRVFKQMSSDLFLYLSHHSVNFFANNMAGSLANKSDSVATSASSFYLPALYYLFSIGELLFTFTLFLTIDISFAFLFLIVLFISIIIFIYIGKKSIYLRAQMADAKNKVAGNMVDALQNNFFVRIFNGFKHESNRAKKVLSEEADITNHSVLIELFLGDGQKLYFNLFYIFSLLYGFNLWLTDKIDNAQLVLVFLLMKDVGQTVSHIIQRAVIYSGTIQELRTNLVIFATPHDIVDIPFAVPLKVSKGEIEFKNVMFGYEKSKPIFKNFSLHILPRQKIGIVGLSGSGKSTLINLIERFYDIQDGQILIDGQDIKCVTQQSLHENISYIAQTTTLLEQSIACNIAYGKPNAHQRQIVEAAKIAYADEFIQTMPNKYQTILKSDNQLSGGQRQRIAIARAVLKNAPILILDEATSALDNKSEVCVQKAIDSIIQDKTVIVVAHRLSTLKNMDRIIVIKRGKIIEDGTPIELLKQGGAFAEFWKLQQLKEKEDE